MSYKPEFKGPIQGFVVNFVNKNYWRVQRVMEREDVHQEAYLVFLRLQRKFPDLESGAHFMALFKTSWIRRFHDISKVDTKSRMFLSADTDFAQDTLTPGKCYNDGPLGVMLRQAPSEVRSVLSLFLNAPTEILEVLLKDFESPSSARLDGGGKSINRALGFPANFNAIKEVRDYLLK